MYDDGEGGPGSEEEEPKFLFGEPIGEVVGEKEVGGV